MSEALLESFAPPPVSPQARAARLHAVGGESEPEKLRDAETAVAGGRYAEALLALEQLPRGECASIRFRALLVESEARLMLGQLDDALAAAEAARVQSEAMSFADLDRAEALFRLGCCRYKLGGVSVASSLFTLAIELAERSGRPSDRLRSGLYDWRSRCRQRHREWDAARADAERALELATGVGDERLVADANFRASVLSQRTGQHLLARFYAEEARAGYESTADRLMLARILNNLGGLDFLLGDAESAVSLLEQAIEIARSTGSKADAAQALSSLAQVHLRSGRPDQAEREAVQALDELDGRRDYLDEIGNAQLVVGRALTEQGRYAEAAGWLADAEASYAALGWTSNRAAAWVAQGDLAQAEGADREAAALFRRAAESLQDFHF